MKLLVAALLLVPLAVRAAEQGPPPAAGDYPQTVRHDYVVACSVVNGGTPEAEKSCTCAIDVIASVLPFDSYEHAETILRMRQMGGGYLAQEFRVATTNDMLRRFNEAQAEAEVRCF